MTQHHPQVPCILSVLALLAVAGCAARGGTAAAAATAKPLTCAQQYQAWRTGPANAPGRKLQDDASALAKANDDIPVMVADLRTLGADATALQAYPVPRCADPAGYWQQYLSDLRAAGDNAGSASGLAALMLAMVPLRQVPGIQAKLSAELARTAAVKTAAPVPLPTLPAADPSLSPLPTLATVAPATVPALSPLPSLATVAPLPTTGT